MNADTKEAVITSLATLHKELKVGENIKHLVVVTDAKIFPYVHDIKKEHPDDFKWLIPYLGDFHILLNYQKVIMKVYWDAGLKQLATASGATLSSLQNCSNFTNTTLPFSCECVHFLLFLLLSMLMPTSWIICNIYADSASLGEKLPEEGGKEPAGTTKSGPTIF